jgi:5-methylcytosine-specific restriction endonuclease McrA
VVPVKARPAAMSIEELLSSPKRNRNHIKIRLLKAGLKEARCEICGLTEWRGQPISLQLHHINGDGKDNRLVNLQMTCPNCHSQTETWGGKNRRRKKGGGAV